MRKFRNILVKFSALALLVLASFSWFIPSAAANALEPSAQHSDHQKITISYGEIADLAREAYLYGYPMVENYRNIFSFAADSNKQLTGFNQIEHDTELIDPSDRQVITPNSDTLYSYLTLDLRAEPIILTLPKLKPTTKAGKRCRLGGLRNCLERYYSVQLVDLYTHNFDYIGTRKTGNGGGNYMIAGPNWDGEVPDGIDLVIPCESEIALALYRTQVFGEEDISYVVDTIQPDYKVQTLSAFLSTTPPIVETIDWPLPPSNEQMDDPAVFDYLNFLLDFVPPHPTELGVMKKFAKINIGPGLAFDAENLTTAQSAAVSSGIQQALKEQKELIGVDSGDLFGTRCFLKNKYIYRFSGAKIGIYGNDREEAFYPIYEADSNGIALNASNGASYTMHFDSEADLPPAKAFWSLTMYGADQFLVENDIDRYLLNSPMMSDFVRDGDGDGEGITFYIQHTLPAEAAGDEDFPNWLPAPDGGFVMVMRLYLPENNVLEGNWTQPEVRLTN